MGIGCPGMVWRRLEVEGIEELLGRGVHYGAGRSEASQCEDRDVVVVGGRQLRRTGGHAPVGRRGPREDAGPRRRARELDVRYLVERIEDSPLIEVKLGTAVEEVESRDGRLAAVVTRAGGRQSGSPRS